jgi:hypothetical protein
LTSAVVRVPRDPSEDPDSTSAVDSGPDSPAPDATPSLGHRGLSLVAVIAVLSGIRAAWTAAFSLHPALGVAVIASCAALLALGATAAHVRTRRALGRADAAVLLIGLLLFGCTTAAGIAPGGFSYDDVGVLLQTAARSLLAGQPIYGLSHPHAGALLPGGAGAPVTAMMNGHIVSDYGYPPLAAVFAAFVEKLAPGLPSPIVVSRIGLAAGAVLLFRLLPPTLRPAAPVVCFVLPMLPKYAQMGYPVLVALPLLVVAVAWWPSIGAGGRLGWRGILKGICLGLAAATHPLAWFLAPFLVIGVWLVRRGEVSSRAATAVTARWLAAAAAAFVAVNLPFVLQGPAAWAHGIAEPLFQHAVPIGQGLVGVTLQLTGGSGALAWYGYASQVLLIGLLIAFSLGIRRLAPAAMVLPWAVFFLSTRSQDDYYCLLAPLWLLGATISLRPEQYLRAHQLWSRRLNSTRSHKSAVRPRAVWPLRSAAAVLPAAALVCAAVAVATPAPLQLSVTGLDTAGKGIRRIHATVTNTSGNTLSPHFAVTHGSGIIPGFWTVQQGPAMLKPGQSASYTLLTTGSAVTPGRNVRLRVVSDNPLTLSSTLLAPTGPATHAPGR